MLDQTERIDDLDNTAADQAYQAAVDILADILLAYLTSEKAKETNPGRTGGFGSTGPAPCLPLAV